MPTKRVGASSLCRLQKRANNSSNFEGVYVLHELDMPDARRIIELEALANGRHCSKIQARRLMGCAEQLAYCFLSAWRRQGRTKTLTK